VAIGWSCYSSERDALGLYDRGAFDALHCPIYREYLRRMLPRLRWDREEPLDVIELSSSVLKEIIAKHAGAPLPNWCRVVTMEEYGRSHHDRVREELLQQWLHDPSAWSRRRDKIVFRSEDIHGTVAKLCRDVPDYLYGSGSKGNVIVFEREELERFLGIAMFSKKGRLGALTRLFGSRPRCSTAKGSRRR